MSIRPVASDAESFAAAAYLQGHDFAVRWAKANRELIARRFVRQLGAEAECLWDGCHNSITPREHEGETVWVHRKGAVAAEGELRGHPGFARLAELPREADWVMAKAMPGRWLTVRVASGPAAKLVSACANASACIS